MFTWLKNIFGGKSVEAEATVVATKPVDIPTLVEVVETTPAKKAPAKKAAAKKPAATKKAPAKSTTTSAGAKRGRKPKNG